MPLTDTAARNAKPAVKAVKLFDEKGLFLLVAPGGGKWWRFKYRFAGKEKQLSFGVYPEVSLKEAREKRDEARALLRKGVDPSAARKQAVVEEAGHNTFMAVALEWHEKFSPNWTERHAGRVLQRLERHAFPLFGHRPIREVVPPDLLAAVRPIEAAGALETAHRVLQTCGQVFRYAVATGQAERDLSADLRGALRPVKVKHHASLTDPKDVAGLLRAIAEYKGSFVTLCALRLAPLVFVRPGELRRAEWSEIDLDAAEWRIPAARMKMREQHIVPLSRQAVAVLRELHPLTGSGRLVFPSLRTGERPMSENTINAALRRLGYTRDEMTGHGFRSMASTILNEQGWNRDAIERQLAHAERDEVRAAYNYAEHLPERRRMMQAWADYLDALKAGARVRTLRSARPA